MQSQDLKKYNLPNSPGIYLFKKSRTILYIGKATSLKARMRSYFASDLIATRGPLIVDMVFQAKTIGFIKTNSVLEALILEANLIKKHQPKYNTKEKDNKSFNYVVITKEDFPRVLISRERELQMGAEYKIAYQFGPFTNGGQLKEALKMVRKVFPFRDKCLPAQLLPTGKVGRARPCFNRQIGLCPGVCTGEVSKNDYRKIISNVILFFQGKKKELLNSLDKEMKNLAKKQEFEKADMVRKKIYALNHIQDVALIKRESVPILFTESRIHDSINRIGRESGYRIEAYDIAHLAGKEVVGVMTVVEDGEVNRSDYRKFAVNDKPGIDDTRALAEVLTRRLKHTEWPYPNLIVVDGGIAQKNVADRIIARNKMETKVVSVVKDERHRPANILGDQEIVKQYKDKILLANSEAHRFAISYHRQKRRNVF